MGKKRPPSEETKKKISESLKGHEVSEETRKKISGALKGREQDLEVVKRRTESLRGHKKRLGSRTGKGPRSEETKKKIGDAHRGKVVSDDVRQQISNVVKDIWADPDSVYNSEEYKDKHRGRYRGQEARGYSVVEEGYVVLSGQQEHPLTCGGGILSEHRKVLYDEIGLGPHYCYWNCGKLLEWGGIGGICVDHLDGDVGNNDPGNLVPSCSICNMLRARAGNPVDWLK